MVEEKVAIVTGGSSGIGQATCTALSRVGYRIVVVGTNRERIDQTLKMLENEPHLGLCADVTEERDMQDMVDRTQERFGRIDLLVASAGLGKGVGQARVFPYPTAELPLEEWHQILNVNLTGVFLSNRAVLPVMQRQKGGHIINICSSTTPRGLRGTPYAPAYCASKFGVTGFTEALAEEVRGEGIRVQALFPGIVNTPMSAGTPLSQLHRGTFSVQSVAKTIVFLARSPVDILVVHPHILHFVRGSS